jgi:hypothetical protein
MEPRLASRPHELRERTHSRERVFEVVDHAQAVSGANGGWRKSDCTKSAPSPSRAAATSIAALTSIPTT